MMHNTDLAESVEALAMKIACKAVMDYGEGDASEAARARNGNLWRDHPAYQAALAALRARKAQP
jgi:hypothetical protein